MYRIGIDVGGTFTDFTLVNETTGEINFYKVPSTPYDPSEAIQRGIADLLSVHVIPPEQVSHVGHGTTVATNLIIERKGAKSGLITTRGFRDVLEIGRQTRPHLYDYSIVKPPVLIERAYRIEVDERLSANGEILRSLDQDAVRKAAIKFRNQGIEAVTVCFLHSYRNPLHEQQAKRILREEMPDAYISISSEVLPEFREYERLSTTALNAAVGPRMETYLRRFLDRIKELGIQQEPFTIHSNGGLMSIETVSHYPVRTCLSGPAAGVVGAAAIGRKIHYPNLVTFDVGGTSTDVSLIYQGQPLFTSNRQIADYPVKTPMIDIHVIGAGGGSIAWMDDAGSLKVGPHSAGAVPGPVGYARGGEEPTITDAEITLRRLNPSELLKGRMKVDAEGARRVIQEKIADPLGLTLEEAAEGIIRIANANMSRAIRSVSTERGYDLSEFALYAYGGAGPLHALEVAEECGIPIVIVPQEPGTMCARGMLLTDISFDFVRSEISTITPENWPQIVHLYETLKVEGDLWLERERVAPERRQFIHTIDARYAGQNFEVQVTLEQVRNEDYERFTNHFHQAHLREYGYNVPARAIEVVNCRLKAVGAVVKAPLQRKAAASYPPLTAAKARSVYHGKKLGWLQSKVFDRDLLPAGFEINGPAVIEEMSSTTVLSPNHQATVDDYGNLIIQIAPRKA